MKLHACHFKIKNTPLQLQHNCMSMFTHTCVRTHQRGGGSDGEGWSFPGRNKWVQLQPWDYIQGSMFSCTFSIHPRLWKVCVCVWKGVTQDMASTGNIHAALSIWNYAYTCTFKCHLLLELFTFKCSSLKQFSPAFFPHQDTFWHLWSDSRKLVVSSQIIFERQRFSKRRGKERKACRARWKRQMQY